MLWRSLGLSLLFLLSLTANAQTQQRLQGFCEKGGEVVVTDGRSSVTRVQRSYPSCTITVFVAGTSSLATIYSDYSSTPLANPFTANTDGYWSFVAGDGRYDVRMSGGGLASPVTRSGLWVAAGGGGGGGVGPGTIDRLPRFDTTTTIADSIMRQVGTSEFKFAATGKRINLDTGSQLVVEIANAAVTGTAVNRLAKLTGAPSTAVVTATTDTSKLVGIVASGAGTTGSAQIVTSGTVACEFDGATTAGNYVGSSTTLAGRCKDLGSSLPVTGVQVIGRVLSTNVAAGTYNVYVFTGEQHPNSTGLSGVTNYVAFWDTASSISAAPDFFRDATTDPANPEYILQDNLHIFTTQASSQFRIDTDQVVIQGSSIRANAANMLTLKATATQSGDFIRATNSGGTSLFRIRSTGQPMFGGLNFTFPSAYAVTTPECMQMSSTGAITLTGSGCGGGSSSLTATYIGFGSAGNTLTGSSNLTWNDTTKVMSLASASTIFIDLNSGSTASAIRMPAGASPASHPGSGGGLIFPNVGGDQTSGPGVWWSGGNYNNTSGLWLSLGLNWQGYGTAGSPFKVRKGTGTSATGGLVFEVRPDDGQVNLYPFGTSPTNTTTVNFFELAANGTSRVELGGPDSLAATIRLTLPSALPGSTQCMTLSNTGVIATAACGSGGTPAWSDIIDPTGNLSLAMATNLTTFTWAGNTSTNNLFTYQDTSGNTGTGSIVKIASIGTSDISPLLVQVQGSDALKVVGDGAPAGRVDINAINSATVPLRVLEAVGQAADAIQVRSTAPATVFSVGANGSINVIRSVAYSWPSSQGAASTVLTNDGSGNLTWTAPAAVALPAATLVSSNYTALTTDWLVSMDATAANRTVTLYSASGNSGRIVQIFKRDNTVNTVAVTDGSTTWTIYSANAGLQFVSNGTTWVQHGY